MTIFGTRGATSQDSSEVYAPCQRRLRSNHRAADGREAERRRESPTKPFERYLSVCEADGVLANASKLVKRSAGRARRRLYPPASSVRIAEHFSHHIPRRWVLTAHPNDSPRPIAVRELSCKLVSKPAAVSDSVGFKFSFIVEETCFGGAVLSIGEPPPKEV